MARMGLINLGGSGTPSPVAAQKQPGDVYINVGGNSPTGPLGVAPGDSSDPLPLAERYLQTIGRLGGQGVGVGEEEK
jgi:hypothetical protein